MRYRLTALVLLALHLAAAPAFAGEGRLPSEACGRFFLVPVDLAGEAERRLWMLLDTGAERTVVDPGAVERVMRKSVRPGARVDLRDVSAGPLRIRRLRAQALDLAHLGVALGRPIDGILGYDAFAGLLLTLDYPAGEARIAAGELPPPDGKAVFGLRGRKRPYLPMEIGGETVVLLIDSGSGSSISVGARPLTWKTAPRTVGAYARIRNIELREAGRLDGELRLGATPLVDPIVELTEGTELVGTAVLRHFQLTFDTRRRRVLIRPASPGPIEAPPVRGTGALLGPVGGGLQVLQVVPGSPAEESGIEVGDPIVQIDGLDVLRQGCERRARAEERSETVLFRIDRDGGTLEIEIPVTDLVP